MKYMTILIKTRNNHAYSSFNLYNRLDSKKLKKLNKNRISSIKSKLNSKLFSISSLMSKLEIDSTRSFELSNAFAYFVLNACFTCDTHTFCKLFKVRHAMGALTNKIDRIYGTNIWESNPGLLGS